MSQASPAQAKLTLRVVWATLLISQLIYVGLLLAGFRSTTEPFELPFLTVALGVVAVLTGAGSHFCWRRASGSGHAFHEQPPDPAKSFHFYMVAWVLDESIAIYGLLLGLLAFSGSVWGPFSLAGFSLTFLHRPS